MLRSGTRSKWRRLRVRSVRPTDRLEAFSAGVIAIAITLLVIEIRPPHTGEGQGSAALLRALGDLWPNYLGDLISFLTIGIMWINHHNIFRFFARTDPWLVALNTLFLLCVGFVPFPTALLAEYLGHPGSRAAALVYGVPLGGARRLGDMEIDEQAVQVSRISALPHIW